jgi:hypothetical protein
MILLVPKRPNPSISFRLVGLNVDPKEELTRYGKGRCRGEEAQLELDPFLRKLSAPELIIERNIARELTEKDRW